VISDFKVFEDPILPTNGAGVARIITGRTELTIVLAGADGDRIILQNIPNSGPPVSIEFTDTPFVRGLRPRQAGGPARRVGGCSGPLQSTGNPAQSRPPVTGRWRRPRR
jgi:hypothetical protein